MYSVWWDFHLAVVVVYSIKTVVTIAKVDLLTNATVVDDAIRFVSEHGKSKDDMNYHQKERRIEEEEKMTILPIITNINVKGEDIRKRRRSNRTTHIQT
jgi:hypothetical protein